jgi:hypothetical protein
VERQIKKTLLSTLVCLALTACGGGGGAAAVIPEVSPRTDLACTAVTNKADLDTPSVYTFVGLTSSWSNSNSVPGMRSSQNFVYAVSNYSAMAKDNNDNQLKSQVVSSIHNWSSANAFKGTKLCWSPANGWDQSCTQWVDPNGNDLSAIQDINFVMEMVESIRRSYSLVSDWAKVNDPAKHQNIMSWLKFWDDNTPNPDDVFFGLGMGRYHWEIQRVAETAGISATVPLVQRLMTGIPLLVNDDGSIVNRTTRGNRALWYHFSSINEIMTSMYLAKQAGVDINPLLETRLHKSVELFLNTLDNPSYILPWARVGYNNGGDGTQQDFFGGAANKFAGWYDSTYAGSWIYLYTNWYINANSAKLKQIVPLKTAMSAFVDRQFGIPLGCVGF